MWLYNGEPFEPEGLDPKEIYGFVYVIVHNKTNKKYIGKKFFWATKTKQVKGKRRRTKVESDWRNYYGSSPHLSKEVKELGTEEYTRHILHLCKSKSECAYLEAYEQFVRGVLLSDEYYNDWISCRVTSRHLEKVKQLITEKIDDNWE